MQGADLDAPGVVAVAAVFLFYGYSASGMRSSSGSTSWSLPWWACCEPSRIAYSVPSMHRMNREQFFAAMAPLMAVVVLMTRFFCREKTTVGQPRWWATQRARRTRSAEGQTAKPTTHAVHAILQEIG